MDSKKIIRDILGDGFKINFELFFRFRLVDTLDQIDTRVEQLRKEALNLCEKRDVLLMSMDIIKNNELLQGLNECKLFNSEFLRREFFQKCINLFLFCFRHGATQMNLKKSPVIRNA